MSHLHNVLKQSAIKGRTRQNRAKRYTDCNFWDKDFTRLGTNATELTGRSINQRLCMSTEGTNSPTKAGFLIQANQKINASLKKQTFWRGLREQLGRTNSTTQMEQKRSDKWLCQHRAGIANVCGERFITIPVGTNKPLQSM